MSDENKSRFEKAGAEKQAGLMGELFAMMKQNKKYWLLPIVIILLLFGLLILLGASSAAPFIYTLF
jgi:ABC-type microcin C transport system permease subunit YejE